MSSVGCPHHHHHRVLMFQNLTQCFAFWLLHWQCGRHLNGSGYSWYSPRIQYYSVFREFTEIPTEHSVAKRARGMFPGNPFIRASLLTAHSLCTLCTERSQTLLTKKRGKCNQCKYILPSNQPIWGNTLFYSLCFPHTHSREKSKKCNQCIRFNLFQWIHLRF